MVSPPETDPTQMQSMWCYCVLLPGSPLTCPLSSPPKSLILLVFQSLALSNLVIDCSPPVQLHHRLGPKAKKCICSCIRPTPPPHFASHCIYRHRQPSPPDLFAIRSTNPDEAPSSNDTGHPRPGILFHLPCTQVPIVSLPGYLLLGTRYLLAYLPATDSAMPALQMQNAS